MAQNNQKSNSPGDGWEIEGDLSQVEERKEAPPGRWLCKIATMEKKPTKDKTKDFFNIAFEILDTDKPELEGYIGSRVFDIFNINQEALWKLKALGSAAGFDMSGSRVPNMTDAEVILDTFEEEWEGQRRLKTKRYKNPESEGWHGIHETRDATTGEPAKDKAQAPAPATGGDKLAGKKLASGDKKGKNEVEI